MTDRLHKATGNGKGLAGKYLTFALGNEEYGLEILKVREIVGYQNITSVPKTPKAIKGVINLRGQVIPIIDLRCQFGMEEKEISEQTCIIVVENKTEDRTYPTGVIVDKVSEVLDIGAAQIEEAPDLGANTSIDFIQGIGKIGNAVKILLDIDKVICGQGAAQWAEISDSLSAQ